MSLITLFWMIFCHIIDDYYLQGCLAQLKQKKYWKENAPDALYKYDYIVALIMHGFSWSFMITLPILIYKDFDPPSIYYMLFLLNIYTHVYVDDLKANRHKINLIVDQLIHLLQILITFFAFLAFDLSVT